MAENGNNWIKLNRSITDHWLWSSGETFSRGQAFIDLLLMAAYADHPVMSQGKKIDLKRGSMVTSIRYLSDRWRWSKDKTMHFLNDLEADGTIKKVSDTKRTVLTIVNYDKYQGLVTSERTQNGHKTDAERTQNGQTKERKEGKRNISNIFVPPTVEEVKAYCEEKGYSVDPCQFVDFYESKGWMVGKSKMKDWKASVRTWQRNNKTGSVGKKNSFNNFEQRKYDMREIEKDFFEKNQ
ncbi:MAG: hypothetical protein ACI4EE_10335 [Lachnospiraceae bacterium]